MGKRLTGGRINTGVIQGEQEDISAGNFYIKVSTLGCNWVRLFKSA